MIIIDYDKGKEYSRKSALDVRIDSSSAFIFCRPDDMPMLRETFGFDESTVLDCMDIDESVRFTAFDGYDFASLVHLETDNNAILFNEINLYISRRYIILVMPEQSSRGMTDFEEKMLAAARNQLNTRQAPGDLVECLNQIFFIFFNILISHFSDTLELLEDRMQELSDKITRQVENEHLEDINELREKAYFIKKILRAFSYMGLQILCNENDFITKKKLFLFRNLDTRFRKLYDFSESVYGLSSELLNTYDSKITQRTNDIINKLTFVTLFFGPLTVITGIYGMNFRIMPELDWRFGYPLTIGFMLLLSVVIYIVMKKKKWL